MIFNFIFLNFKGVCPAEVEIKGWKDPKSKYQSKNCLKACDVTGIEQPQRLLEIGTDMLRVFHTNVT